MTRRNSERLKDLFGARVLDLTPAYARQAARVLYAPISRNPELSRCCATVLSMGEQQRADRFAAERHRVQFIQRRGFRRFCAATALGSSKPLSRIDFEETEKGQPYLPDSPGLRFSFSSCPFGVLGAWSPTHGIGVDLEDHTRALEVPDLARRYFSKAEASIVNGQQGHSRTRAFLQLWSLKEAALKSIGEGLPYGLNAFQFELVPSLRFVHAPAFHGGPRQFEAYTLDETGGSAALVIRSGV